MKQHLNEALRFLAEAIAALDQADAELNSADARNFRSQPYRFGNFRSVGCTASGLRHHIEVFKKDLATEYAEEIAAELAAIGSEVKA